MRCNTPRMLLELLTTQLAVFRRVNNKSGSRSHATLDITTFLGHCERVFEETFGSFIRFIGILPNDNTLKKLNVNSATDLGNTDAQSKKPLPTAVSDHFTLPGHSINDIELIPLELIHSSRDSICKAREAFLISKGKTLKPHGINRRDET